MYDWKYILIKVKYMPLKGIRVYTNFFLYKDDRTYFAKSGYTSLWEINKI